MADEFGLDPTLGQYVDPNPFDWTAATKAREADMLANPARYNPNVAMPDPMTNRDTNQSVWRYDPYGGWGAYASDVGTQFGKDFGPGGFMETISKPIAGVLNSVGEAGLAAGAGGIAGMWAGPMLYDTLFGGGSALAGAGTDYGAYDAAAGMVSPADLATMNSYSATPSIGMDLGSSSSLGDYTSSLGSSYNLGGNNTLSSMFNPMDYLSSGTSSTIGDYGSLVNTGSAKTLDNTIYDIGGSINLGSAPALSNVTPSSSTATGTGAPIMSNNVTTTGLPLDLNAVNEASALTSGMSGIGGYNTASQPAWYDTLLSKAKDAITDPLNILKVGSSLINMQQGKDQAAKMEELSKRMEGKADPFGSQRAGYQNLLSQSYSNPMGSAENQGLMNLYRQAAARKAAAQGQRANPIHENIALSQAMLPQLNAQRQTLAGLAGANQSPTAGMDTYGQLALKAMQEGRNAGAQPLYALSDIFTPKSKETQQLEALRSLLLGAKG